MPTLVHDCPRCGATRTTFDVLAAIDVERRYSNASWQSNHEVFGVCRNCHVGTIFILMLTEYDLVNRGWSNELWSESIGLNDLFEVVRFVSLVDKSSHPCPDFAPEKVKNAFDEGAACMAIGCNNAAVSMFRLAIDLATKNLLPEDGVDGGPNAAQRKKLYNRIEWLHEKRIIGDDLLELASCVREDGNDGVHDGSLTEADGTDNLEFCEALLRRLFTEPARIEQAKLRREARRADG